MDFLTYKIIHLVGIAFTVAGMAAIATQALLGFDKRTGGLRWMTGIAHGVGLLLVIVGGFGMLARLNLSWPYPGWALAKFGIWIVVGGLISLASRKRSALVTFYLLPVIVGLAAWIGIFKPF